MSEAAAASGRPPRIRFERSSVDADAARFTLERNVIDGAVAFADANEAQGAPLAEALFALEQVRHVQLDGAVITLLKRSDAEWDALKRPAAEAIRAALAAGGDPLGGRKAQAPVGARDDAALETAIQTMLDREANPAIASHGGRVDVVDVARGVLRVRMSGGCQGCASSTATLRDGVERMIRAAAPEITRIEDVTDHEAGAAPYFPRGESGSASGLAPEAAAPGASALLTRPVPQGAIMLREGAHEVSATYLAPRLGLDPETLRAEMRAGRVVSREERGEGADAGRTRLTIRFKDRAWRAVIGPDGAAVETPAPAADPAPGDGALAEALAPRARAWLEAAAPETLPVPYATLAEALGLEPPHAIRRAALALEATMAEDAEAGRPFIAALVIGRARGGLPAAGFFERAAALGRGPQPGESERDFHAREMAAARALLGAPGLGAPDRAAQARPR